MLIPTATPDKSTRILVKAQIGAQLAGEHYFFGTAGESQPGSDE
jgi:hypothetical protein